MIDLTLSCPTCGKRADMCFAHGDVWKRRERSGTLSELHRMTDDEIRAGVNEFTEDDPPPYGRTRPIVALVKGELIGIQAPVDP